MKITLSVIFLFLSQFINSANLYSQTPTLTKEETINYLNKKIQAVEGHKRTIEGITFSFVNLSFETDSKRKELITISYDRKNREEMNGDCDYVSQSVHETFNPALITSVELFNKGASETIGVIKINVIPKTVTREVSTFGYTKRNSSGKCYQYEQAGKDSFVNNDFTFYYIKNEPNNFERITKALLYLRDLSKAEEDPFNE